MVEVPAKKPIQIYEHGSIVIDRSSTNNIPALHYQINDQPVTKILQPGGPTFGNSEIIHEDAGLRFWYDQPLRAWVIENTLSPGSELTDTIFIPDEGEAYVRRSKRTMSWSHTFSPSTMLGVVLVVSLIFVVVRFM